MNEFHPDEDMPPLPLRPAESEVPAPLVVDEEILLLPPSALAPKLFCDRCGAAWDASWSQCPACVASARSSVPDYALALRKRLTPAPSLGSCLGLYFSILGTIIVTTVGAVAGGAEPASAIILADLFMTMLVLVWTGISLEQVKSSLLNFGRPIHYLAAVGAAVVTAGLAIGYCRMLRAWPNPEELSYSEPFLEAQYGWTVIILTICVQPAIIEELAFRGVIFRGLEKIMDIRSAVIASSVMFMTLHLTVLGFPILLAIGLVLGVLRWKSGSLYPAMVMHFAHNLLIVAAEGTGW